jgi:hypothetical protein
MRDNSNVQNYSEYIINLIFIDDNLLFLNKDFELLKFIDRCNGLKGTSKIISVMDNDSLVTYDTTIRLFAHIIYEKIPAAEEIDLPNTPSIDDFKRWLAQLSDNCGYALLNYMINRGYISITNDPDLQFMINVLETVRVLEK